MTTIAQAADAERFAAEQRLRFAPLMKVDTSKISAPAEAALCGTVAELAESDPIKWDAILAKPEVNKLFARGALHFGGIGK